MPLLSAGAIDKQVVFSRADAPTYAVSTWWRGSIYPRPETWDSSRLQIPKSKNPQTFTDPANRVGSRERRRRGRVNGNDKEARDVSRRKRDANG